MSSRTRTLARSKARKNSLRPLLAIAGGVVLVAIVIALLLRGPIEKAAITAEASKLVGAPVQIEGVRHDGEALVLTGVSASNALGFLSWHVPQARVTRTASGDKVSFANATVDVASARSTAITLHAVRGTMRLGRGHAAYSLQATIGTGADAGILHGTGSIVADKHFDQHWRADAVPIAALTGIFAKGSGIVPLGGTLRDVTIDDHNGMLSGSARIDGGSFAFDSYAVRKMHGLLQLGNRAIGTQKIEGLFDGYPVTIEGEVDDLPTRMAFIRQGSSDLRSLAWLLRRVATQPKVTSVDLKTIAPGLVFAQYGMQSEHGPLAVSIERMNPAEKSLRFDTAIASDHIFSGGERTSALGVRTGAVAGLNGDYFDIGATYQPQGLLISHGELLHSPGTRAALIIDRNNRLHIDNYEFEGRATSGRHSFAVTQLNWWPPGKVTVITPAFGKDIPPAPKTVFAQLTPIAGAANQYRVERVTPCTSPIPATFGLAFGPLTHDHLQVGETVTLTYKLKPDITDAYSAIGGGPWLLRDGAWFEDKRAPAPDERDVRWPVDAIGEQRNGYLLLVAVDGRHPERSVGMTRPEFGKLLLDFDVTDAFALDSGGSVTMIGRAPGEATPTLRNQPSDNSAERWISDALFVYSSAPLPKLLTPTTGPTPIPEVRPTP